MNGTIGKDMAMTRRTFLFGSVAAGAAIGPKKKPPRIDPNRVVLTTDIHIPLPWSEQKYRTGREYPWIIDTVKAYLAEILTLRPLPANFISLGDMSLAFGEEREYEILRELLEPIRQAGIRITLGMGNHDIRASFAKSFPEEAARSLVPGRYVYRVETPQADFVILDTLKEPTVRGSYPAVTGHELGAEQKAWAKEMLQSLTKPTFVCAHHPIGETGILKEICRAPQVKGYFFGHLHRWRIDSVFDDYGEHARTIRTTGLGSFGIDNYVGYAVMDIAPEKAVMRILSKDFYFPTKRPPAERPPLWDELARDYNGKRVVFPLA